MQVKTILNRIQKHRSFVERERASDYDTLPARRFEFVPLWGLAVFVVYAMRRVSCPSCG
jgi:hypothetical protein